MFIGTNVGCSATNQGPNMQRPAATERTNMSGHVNRSTLGIPDLSLLRTPNLPRFICQAVVVVGMLS